MKRLFFVLLILCVIFTTVNCNCRVNLSMKESTEEQTTEEETTEEETTEEEEEGSTEESPSETETDRAPSGLEIQDQDGELVIIVPDDEDTFGE